MRRLPVGWAVAPLGELVTVGSGGTPKRSDPSFFGGRIPWVTISDLNDGVVAETREHLTESGLASCSAKLVPPEAVLVALYGSIGKLGRAGVPLATNQAIAVAYPDTSAYDSRYLFHYLASRVAELNGLGSGVTQKNIYLGDIKAFGVYVAPRREQSRIVEKLEELLSDLDAGVAELRAAQAKLKLYRQSLLKAAVTGELTASWRGRNVPHETGQQLLARFALLRRQSWESQQLTRFKERDKTPPSDWQRKYAEPMSADLTALPKLPDGWVWSSLDQLLCELRSGNAETSGRQPTAHAVLKSSAVRHGRIDFEAANYLEAEQSQRAENYLELGDILITRLSGSIDYVGCCAVVRTLPQHRIQYPDRVFRGKLPSSMTWLGDYLVVCFQSALVRNRLEAAAKSTAGHKRISLSDLYSLPIPLPPIEEVREIISQTDVALDSVKECMRAIELSERQFSAQRKNILQAAFSGRLVPQDPSDEPASVLLARIRASRADKASVPSRRPRKAKEPA